MRQTRFTKIHKIITITYINFYMIVFDQFYMIPRLVSQRIHYPTTFYKNNIDVKDLAIKDRVRQWY